MTEPQPPQLPFERPDPLRGAPLLRALQARGPVHEIRTVCGDPALLVTGYQEVRRLLADPRLGRSHPNPRSAARTGESVLFGGPLGDYETEEADRILMRDHLQPFFAPGRMRVLRTRVNALVGTLLDELARHDPPADLVESLAAPLPILVICELLGVPYEDHARFRAWTRAAADAGDRARSEQGLSDLFGYGLQLVALKREHPGDDVISGLCAAGDVSDEIIAGLSMFLLFAGHETTVTAISMGALTLLSDRRQWQALQGDPALITATIEEMLRVLGKGGGGIPRYAREDLDVCGVPVRAGDLVLLDTGAANHDAEAFPEPDGFDITRQGTSHLTFGHGPRYCIGAPLARIEMQAVFSQLVSWFPEMRLADPAERLSLSTGVFADALSGGPTRLPVMW
jgi:cytochrome P450